MSKQAGCCSNYGFKVLVRFVPEEVPLPDEIESIKRADKNIARYGTVPHESINWD